MLTKGSSMLVIIMYLSILSMSVPTQHWTPEVDMGMHRPSSAKLSVSYIADLPEQLHRFSYRVIFVIVRKVRLSLILRPPNRNQDRIGK